MSGAFNIDIECGNGAKPKSIKIYCASLTDTWSVERDQIALAQFHASLSKEQSIQKNKINLGQCPKTDNIDACEQFLSRLGCTAAVLRIGRFHDFLNVPQSVRDGLTYASHKPFGKSIREGSMQRHPRFVRRGGGKRYIRLTKDDRGGSIICYLNENNKNSQIASLKIGASTEMQNLKDKGIPNAFVLKSGKRQWVLQASSTRDYNVWQAQLMKLLKEFGPVNMNNSQQQQPSAPSTPLSTAKKVPNQAAPASPVSSRQSQQNTGKLVKENQELTEKVKKMKIKISNMASEIDRLKDLEIEMKNNEVELKRKGQKQFQREKEDLIAEYEVKQDNLRQEIEELHQQLENKTATEGGRSGLKSLFTEDYEVVNLDDYKDGDKLDDDDDDDDLGAGAIGRAETANLLDDDDDEEDVGGRYKYLHKHLHRHDHKHIHDHRHTHIHDHMGDKPITYTHTNTIAHTITHTMTQFKVKKNALGI